MDTKELGIELAKLIEEMVNQSVDDICSALGELSQNIFLEYISLLLWIVTKEASIALPTRVIQSTIDATTYATFLSLEEAGIRKLAGDFNQNSFEDFICNRFDTYYQAWRAFPIEDVQLSEVTVAHNFIVCCFADEAEYREFFPNPKDYTAHIRCVLNHYRRFSERAKSVLSRF